jgi:hypothetical protein
MELIDVLHLLAIACIVLGMIFAVLFFDWLGKHKTGRRGSKYYVPKFTARFDPFLPLWTPQRRAYVAREHEHWQHQFDSMV